MNETKNREKGGTDVAQPAFRPKLAFYHANSRGTGGAVSMDLHPAHGNKDGCIMMRIANQMTIGNRQGPNPTFPRFDWENAIVVKLGFDDLCQILQVFRGECESVGDGKGLIHVTAKASTSIRLRHMIEPVTGYSLEVYRTRPARRLGRGRRGGIPPSRRLRDHRAEYAAGQGRPASRDRHRRVGAEDGHDRVRGSQAACDALAVCAPPEKRGPPQAREPAPGLQRLATDEPMARGVPL